MHSPRRIRVAAKAARTYKGNLFRSKFEATIAAGLDDVEVEWSYEDERITYEIPATYVPDFPIVTPSGRKLYVETKGYFSPEDRRKMLAVKAANPELDIRLVFQKAQTRIARSTRSMSYAVCAETNGFPWADGVIPEEWLK